MKTYETYEMLCMEHGDNCFAIITRFGFGDQGKMHEYMMDNKGIFFDNEGFDQNVFSNKDSLLKHIKNTFPKIVFKHFNSL